MKSHNDKAILFSLVFVGLVAAVLGRGFEIIHFKLLWNSTSINSATALMATEQNLAPEVQQ